MIETRYSLQQLCLLWTSRASRRGQHPGAASSAIVRFVDEAEDLIAEFQDLMISLSSEEFDERQWRERLSKLSEKWDGLILGLLREEAQPREIIDTLNHYGTNALPYAAQVGLEERFIDVLSSREIAELPDWKAVGETVTPAAVLQVPESPERTTEIFPAEG